MTERRWKATERKVAALLGGQRVPVSGRGRGDAPDVRHPWLSIEVKDRAALPVWLLDALAQAEAAAAPDQLAVAVLHRAGRHHADSLVVLRLAAFAEWFADDGESVICRRPPGGAGR
ncbi:MAG TPA: hypothetical protein VFL91_04915 [Thermomicrobiales bacterium]|nr:hypothetical protein [Thermomicrobiales bacterium]